MEPIGFIRTPFPEKFGIPRQPGLAPSAVGNLTLEPQFQKEGVFDGLEEADFLWLVFYFHQQKGEWKPKIRPPRAGGNHKRGVFATRSPNRPNPIGLSVVKLLSVDRKTNTLQLGGVDLLDGTPILDVKPYVPYSDCHPEADFQFAHKPPEPMPVVWSDQALHDLPQDIKKLADEVLCWGPRPAYQRDEREYGTTLKNFNLRWRVVEGKVQVLSSSVVAQGPGST